MTNRMKQVYELVKNSRYNGVKTIFSAEIIDLEKSTYYGNSTRALVRKNMMAITFVGTQKVYIALA